LHFKSGYWIHWLATAASKIIFWQVDMQGQGVNVQGKGVNMHKIFSKLHWKNGVSRVLMAHACYTCYLWGWGQEDHSLRPAQESNLWDSISKITREKCVGGVTQVVKHLLWEHETLSPNLKPTPKKEKPSCNVGGRAQMGKWERREELTNDPG
jgi:hypothetical protein